MRPRRELNAGRTIVDVDLRNDTPCVLNRVRLPSIIPRVLRGYSRYYTCPLYIMYPDTVHRPVGIDDKAYKGGS